MKTSRRSVLLSVLGVLLAPAAKAFGMGDVSTPNDEDVLLTYGALYATGDVQSIGDAPFRIVDTVSGAGLFTQNSDPGVSSIDPLTGLAAPLGTDIGFGSAVRRYIQTGVLNGDFSVPPPRAGDFISPDNPLPYWTWTPATDGMTTAQLVGSSSNASGYSLKITAPLGASGTSDLDQLVPVPRSQGQQYRALLSLFDAGGNSTFIYQYLLSDGVTTIGSAISTATGAGNETKVDAGLVPSTASYLRVRVRYTAGGASIAQIAEVRAAFLPAEASVGLYTRSGDAAGITTSETVVATATIPANSFVAGARYRVRISGTITSNAANAVTLNLRVGPTTLTGTVVTTNGPTATTTATNNGFTWEGTITCRTTGATGTFYGSSFFVGSATQPFTVSTGHSNNTGTSTIDTTVANLIEASVVTGAGTTTVAIRDAVIVCERSA